MKSLKIKQLFAVTILLTFLSCASSRSDNAEEKPEDISPFIVKPDNVLPNLEFKEIWGYVVAGRESALTKNLPVTDIAYFGAEVDAYGKITAVPRRSGLPSHFTGRVHLVIACNGRALTYFTLRPGSAERREFIADLIAETRNFDGLNIDLEYIPARSADAFHSFLRELRAGLPRNKMFSICVPARTRKLSSDVFDYDTITPLADRVFVMAYDEHWSGSRPGSVASIAWCRQVADYSIRAIGIEKLVMGLPFYGRTWGDYSPSRALIYTSVENVIKDNNVTNITYENGVPTFTYNKNVSVRVYYEDEYSLVSRMNMYKTMGVNMIGFWRLGQETPEVWKYLSVTQTSSQAQTAVVSSPSPADVTVQTAPVPETQTSIFTGRYTVQRGDSLWSLSRRYGVSMQSLAEANGMRVNDTLRVGRVLKVPVR